MGIKVHAFNSSNAFSVALQKDTEYEAQHQIMEEKINSLKENVQILEEQLSDMDYKVSHVRGEYHYQLGKCVDAVEELKSQQSE